MVEVFAVGLLFIGAWLYIMYRFIKGIVSIKKPKPEIIEVKVEKKIKICKYCGTPEDRLNADFCQFCGAEF
jgi:hypothetical protein